MRQILVEIPIPGITVSVYGVILFCTFVGCVWQARRHGFFQEWLRMVASRCGFSVALLLFSIAAIVALLCLYLLGDIGAMQQVLFYVPGLNIPIFGFGFMLFCAFVGCMWLAARLARRDGVPKEPIQDLAVWLFVSGILGARLNYVLEYWDKFPTFWQVFAVWDGGLVFYGSIFGALIGYMLAYRFQLKKYGVSHWKMADVIAPCVALGLCLGRIGCLLNGCCFGNVACGSCPAISFPLASMPYAEMIQHGYQTPGGFLTYPESHTVAAVEPASAAARAELQQGDTIEDVNGRAVERPGDLALGVGPSWPRGERRLELDVKSADGAVRKIGPFAPHSLGLHPTQIYESISTALLLFFLLSYYPYKQRDGSLMVLFMFGYGIHRFLNEFLRADNEIVGFGMTFSQNISVLAVIAATILAVIISRRSNVVPNPPLPAGTPA
jgi:phosphatidylglycerol:prolipoprotein diacylglycerol transferase